MNIRRRLAAGLLLLPLALVSAACVGVTRPQGWASPAIDGSTLFILEEKDRLTALEVTESNTANVRWSFPDGSKRDQSNIKLEAVYTTPVIEGTSLYTAGYSGDLVAIDISTGDLVRRRELSGHVAGNIAIDNGQIAVATIEGNLYLVSADDFNPAPGWDRGGVSLGADIWADPVLTGDRVFVATMEGEIVALDRANGRVVWTYEHKGAVPTLALLDEAHLFAGSLSKDVLILDPEAGTVKASFKASDWVWNPPAFQDGVVYFGDFAGKVFALNITTGQLEWAAPYDGGSKVKAGPVIIGDVLVLTDREPTVHFIRLSDGSGLNRVPILNSGTVRSNLVVREGKAVVLTTDGDVYFADPASAPPRVDPVTYGGGR